MPDYQGPLSKFAVIIPVPDDVEADHVTTLRRIYVDRVSQLSAPKFAEFWEMDPCDPEKLEQDWERDMTAKDDTGFLGTMKTDPSTKVAKEMLLDMKARTKDGEYTETLVGDAAGVQAFLAKNSFSLPAGGEANLSSYEASGYKFLVLAVDPNRVELVGGDRAQLSPIRIWTEQPMSKLPTRFGLPSAAKAQELTIFTLVPDQRMQVSNYTTLATPTNLRVVTEYIQSADKKFNLKEKMGDFYAAFQDRYLEKHPKTFLLEYAWASDDCGKPCANEPLLPDELLSLGGDVFEADLPEDVRRPAPPEMTEEEKLKLEGILAGKTDAKEKKAAQEQWDADREELAARKGILERNKYVLSRLHYRYAKQGMPEDVELGPGAPIKGGVGLPLGELGAAELEVKPSEKNEFQTRFNGLFPNKIVVKCDDPKHHRWGKAPRSYRGLRKIWVADDLSRRNRKRITVDKAILTPIPDLGISGVVAEEPAAEVQEAAPVNEEKSSCGCRTAGAPTHNSWGLGAALLAALAFWRRRRSA